MAKKKHKHNHSDILSVGVRPGFAWGHIFVIFSELAWIPKCGEYEVFPVCLYKQIQVMDIIL